MGGRELGSALLRPHASPVSPHLVLLCGHTVPGGPSSPGAPVCELQGLSSAPRPFLGSERNAGTWRLHQLSDGLLVSTLVMTSHLEK